MRRMGLASLTLLLGCSTLSAADPVIRLVEFEKTVTNATANLIIEAIEDADREEDYFVLIELDTPGGDAGALQRIVKSMLGARTPIVVWVGPSGSRAASAGFFILIAADVAAMAPGTRGGAASVVYGVGQSEEGDVLLKKANQDMAALLRSIAERRDRNVEACEKAVLAADAYSESEALKEGIIDLVAQDREALLADLDGMEIKRFDGSTVVLETTGASFVTSEFGFRQELWEFLANPSIAFLLFLIGLAGLYIELSHPGLVFPAVVGVLSLILFFFAAQVLPVSTVGVLLILLAVAMFILEIKVTSFGMLTFGGALCLIIGSMMLIQGPIPELRVPPSLVIPAALTLTALCAVAVRLAIRAQRARVATGVEGLRGKIGTVKLELNPEGKVFVHGELWDATSTRGTLPMGARVRVISAEDMMLKVEPVEEKRTEGG